jgi:hypothetical protein
LLESGEARKLEGMEAGRHGSWKAGRLEGLEARKLKGYMADRPGNKCGIIFPNH